FGRAHGQVVPQARGDHPFLDARQRARLAVEPDQRRVVGVEVFADAGIDAGEPPAGRLDLRILARHAVHVGGRSADVGNDTGEAGRLVAYLLDLVQDGFF